MKHAGQPKNYSLQAIEVDFPRLQEWELENGAKITVLPKVSQEVYFLTLEFNYPEERAKLLEHGHYIHQVLSKCIGKSTKQSDGKTLQTFFDERGAHFYVNATTSSLFIRFSCLSRYWEECMHKIHEIIFDAQLEVKKWRQIQKQTINQLSSRLHHAAYVADRKLLENLFGQDNLVGRTLRAQDVENLNLEDLKQAYPHVLDLKNLHIYIGGNWKEQDIDLVKSLFNQKENPSFSYVDDGKSTQFKAYKPAQFSGHQYSLRWGLKMMAPADELYPTALMTSNVLGGYFGARLMQEIREKRGLSYGAYSYIAPFRDFSSFQIATDIPQNSLDEVQSVIAESMKRMQKEEINQEEWERARNNLIGDLLGSMDGPLKLTNRIRALDGRGLSVEDFLNQIKKIQEMQAKESLAFAEEYLKPESFTKVWIG